ncbi:MAG TPA: hypothetical protein VJ508_09915, partial [Saprospiraceae bacterium]|nr:hypothetical protein [Saprospiraceae bacterium]
MKRVILFILGALPVLGFGQILVSNQGALIKIQAGATLFVEGGIENISGGTIDNDGTLEVQGNFVNSANWEPSQPNTLRFTGNATSDITPGSAIFQTVQDSKGTGANLNLLGNMTVSTNLDFNSAGVSKVTLNNFDLKLQSGATTTGYDADEYVNTNGTGMMQKDVTANATFEFPLGDATNYSPITCNFTGSAYSAANLRTRVNNLTHPNKPADATDYISRYWDVDQTGITGYNNTMTGTFVPGDDIVGTTALVKGAVYDGANWKYAGA